VRSFCTLLAVALVACGGDDASDASSTDAAQDVVTEDASAIDVTSDAPPKDATADAVETGIPPLNCPGDLQEPNDTEILATQLGTIDDCDSSGSTTQGVSSGTGDIDWMVFHGVDTFGCSVDPTVQIDAAGLRMCAFALCNDGTTTIQSCGIGTPAVSPAGTHGCCTTSLQTLTLQIACSAGTDDSAAIFIRVDQPNQNQCVSYDVSYHY
jgi:hypothetical protein